MKHMKNIKKNPVLFVFLLAYSTLSFATVPFKLGNTTFQVTEVTTLAAQQQGLSGVKSLAPNEGMLFVFPAPGIYPFWMKDMLFPLDIIWMDQHYHVIYVKENARPCSFFSCPTYAPSIPAQYVLEIPAGTFQRLQQ